MAVILQSHEAERYATKRSMIHLSYFTALRSAAF